MVAIHIRDGHFWDEDGRTVHLRGINLSGDSKLPKEPDMPSHRQSNFWNSEFVSFVGRPFAIQDADVHLARIVSWGYNVVRFVITWEAIEHAGPGHYDEEYIAYIIEILAKCARHNLMVIMDPHQDVWSRYSGGSGAPYWTFIAAGIDPRQFLNTQAAIVHNTFAERQDFPRMIWSTNYDRLAAATMFILFFAGKHFAPKAVIDGVNIQDYLQAHFFNAMAIVAKRIQEKGALLATTVLGWETMNEPSMSWLGRQNLELIPESQHLRKGTCPTPFQAILTGSGFAQEIEVWDFGLTGPKLKGTTIVDPKASTIWYEKGSLEAKYKWQRAQSWTLGTCIWAQHGVWDPQTRRLLQTDYFMRGPDGDTIDDAAFLRHFWMPHFRNFKTAIRAQACDSIIFCQPPVLKIPPIFNELDRKDPRIVYSPHYYDGLTLMNKTWNTWYNVDVLGVLRGRYLSPIFAVKFGLRAIRNCLRDQLSSIKQEGIANLGNYPCLFSEIGIPFDLDHGKAYETNDYSAQIGALDANNFALEGANAHFTFWHYSVLNDHRWGDFWNGEDLSFVSKRTQIDDNSQSADQPPEHEDPWSTRAAEAIVRPAPIRVAGIVMDQSFDLRTKTFKLKVVCSDMVNIRKVPTVIFLPGMHYHNPQVQTDHGRAVIDSTLQRVFWWHDEFDGGALRTLTINEQKASNAPISLWC